MRRKRGNNNGIDEMKGKCEQQDAALSCERRRKGEAVHQAYSPKTSAEHRMLSAVDHAFIGSKPNDNTANGDSGSQQKKRKFDETEAGLQGHEEETSPCADKEANLSRAEVEQAEEAGLSLLFAASLMQQNDDDEADGDVAPVDTSSSALFDPHHHATATPLAAAAAATAANGTPAFPQLTGAVSGTAAVAFLPEAPSSKAAVSPVPDAGPCATSGTIDPTENDGTFLFL